MNIDRLTTCHILKCLWVEVLSWSLFCLFFFNPGKFQGINFRGTILVIYLIFHFIIFHFLKKKSGLKKTLELTSAVWPYLPKCWHNQNGNPEEVFLSSYLILILCLCLTFKEEERAANCMIYSESFCSTLCIANWDDWEKNNVKYFCFLFVMFSHCSSCLSALL